MAANDKHLHGGANARPARSEPLFTEEAEEEARPVVPLGGTHDEATVVRPRRGKLPRNAALALALVAAGTAGVAAGYMAHTRQAPAPAAEVTAGAAPGQSAPTVSNSPEASAAVPAGRRARGVQQSQVETERPDLKENEGRGRDEEERAAGTKKEEERRRERGKESAERLRDGEKKIAERLREEGKKIIERGRDREKGEKPKARLVDTIIGGSRPF